MNTFSPATQLTLSDIELNVFLGWSDNEQSQPQAVFLDVEIQWEQAPLACLSDQLQDTACYSKLIKAVSESIVQKKFRLIEHLASDVYQLFKKLLPYPAKINIGITKFPKIKI